MGRMGPAAITAAGLLLAPAAFAWTPATQVEIAELAASLAPDDLARQVERHRERFRQGVRSGYALHPGGHQGAGERAGAIDAELLDAVEQAIASIRGHRPFGEVVERLGLVSHLAADLNDALRVSAADPYESRYAADYSRYLEAARQRFAVIFYGEGRRVASPGDLTALVGRALERGSRLYPDVGREYRRVGSAGSRLFDDRSTAFAVGALAYSHAVSDTAAILSYVWRAAGGSEQGALPAVAGDRLVLVKARGSAR